MEWLRDKKNAPIVAAIAGAVIIGVFCLWWFVLRAAPAEAPVDPTAQTAPAPAGDPSAASGAPTDPAAPSATPAAPVTPAAAPATAPAATPAGTPGQTPAPGATAAGRGVQVASVTPMETWRGDPFQPIGYKQPKKQAQPKPHIWDFPYEKLPIRFKIDGGKGKKWEKPEIQQPARRMAGILLNDRVYAIIESNGVSQVVQPGDYTSPDRLAIVERIETDRVVLKTVDEKPRYITVKMAGSPTIQSSGAVSPTPGSPMSRPAPNAAVPGRGGMPSGMAPPPP